MENLSTAYKHLDEILGVGVVCKEVFLLVNFVKKCFLQATRQRKAVAVTFASKVGAVLGRRPRRSVIYTVIVNESCIWL